MAFKDRRSPRENQTPSLSDLQHLLLRVGRSTGPVNRVWPGLYIGNAATARDKATLFNMGITHIVNAAHGPQHINTGARFYRDLPVHYYGVEADDAEDFDLSQFFYPTAMFIRAALSQYGKVLVHCAMGVSRSAALVLAYLMICEQLPLVDAIEAVKQHRDICPNSGFLEQLRKLDMSLAHERREREDTFKLGPLGQRHQDVSWEGGHETPSTSELKRILWTNRHPTGPVDQVWPNLYMGNESTARDKDTLYNLGITHILNAAHGPRRINTGANFYSDMPINYHGVEAADHPEFDLTPFFYSAAKFIQEALSQKGKVLVHCAMGVSRSAALVLAYLMICEQLPLVDAIKAIRQHRHICPNRGFLEQLRKLDMSLTHERREREDAFKL